MNYGPLKLPNGVFALLVVGLTLLVLMGAYCAHVMEHHGHIVTGMNNHVVWGLPHVFAISLIVAASGALNGASLGSVFGVSIYKPYARVSVLLAMTLLLGGLIVLVLDLGRPDRLIIAMTHYNFRSIFTWNIFLYTGFLVIGVAYLAVLMDRRFNQYIGHMGKLAFAWRIVLTTGTGCIFGFLVGRDSLDSALLAPLFIALSFAMGTAVFALAILFILRWQRAPADALLLRSIQHYLRWFLLALLYFSIVHHITNLYVAEHSIVQQFALRSSFSSLFWLGHVFLGVLLPWYLLRAKFGTSNLLAASGFTLVGAAFLLYAIIIGSQSTPQKLFSGKTVTSSSFGDAGFPQYLPSMWEWGFGVGGVSAALLLCVVVLRLFPLIPPSKPPTQVGLTEQ